MGRLFPLCRSLTGDGVRATFDILEEEIPITRTEIPSGTRVFDWIVPDEWNVREAHITAPDGTRVVDLADSTLHVVSYSEPVRRDPPARRAARAPAHPSRAAGRGARTGPPTTSAPGASASPIGSCSSLQPGEYEVVIDSTLEPGHLTYAELLIEGEGEGEVLVSTYVCHPSLANDNLSGIAVATMLGEAPPGAVGSATPTASCSRLARSARSPGSIRTASGLDRIEHGLALSCIGDAGDLTYKRSRRGDAEVDRAMEIVLRDSGAAASGASLGAVGRRRAPVLRPGIRPPGRHPDAHAAWRVQRLSHLGGRAWSGSGPRPWPSAVDSLPRARRGARDATARCINLSPFGEPQLGRRGLYRSAGGAVATPEDERALLWVLNQSDGRAEPARHRTSLRVDLCGCRARRRATRAGGAACGEFERAAAAGPRHDATLGRPRAASPGASGLIGSQVLPLLREADVVALSRTPRPDEDGLRWLACDLAEPRSAFEIVTSVRPEVVIHLAGAVRGDRSLDAVTPTLAANLVASVGLLEAATRVGCRRIVLSGSLLEEPAAGGAIAVPSSPYGASRWAASAYGRMFHALFDAPVVILRPSFAYGPGQEPTKLIPHVIKTLLERRAPAWLGERDSTASTPRMWRRHLPPRPPAPGSRADARYRPGTRPRSGAIDRGADRRVARPDQWPPGLRCAARAPFRAGGGSRCRGGGRGARVAGDDGPGGWAASHRRLVPDGTLRSDRGRRRATDRRRSRSPPREAARGRSRGGSRRASCPCTPSRGSAPRRSTRSSRLTVRKSMLKRVLALVFGTVECS